MTFWKWSKTAANNDTADSTINWRENQSPSTYNNAARAMMAAAAKYRDDMSGNLVLGGTDTAYTVTTNQVLTALTDGFTFFARMNATNGVDATLAVDSLTAKQIRSVAGTNMPSGRLVNNSMHQFTYDSSDDAWIVAGATADYAPGGTDVAVADGGTGASTATAGFDNLSPVTTRGDLIIRDASNNVRLAIGAANRVLRSDGTDPSWGQVVNGDITDTTIAHGKLATAVTASQAVMEARTATDSLVSPGRQHFHPGHPKAGGNLSGTGTPAFASGDYGMGSVTDNGSGDYTVGFDTAFASTDYWLAGFGRSDIDSTIHMAALSAFESASKTTSEIRLKGFGVGGGSAGADTDLPEMGMSFWGDYA